MLQIGDKAPDFKLKSDNGDFVRLKDFKGHKVILYFYPKDMTSGCTNEACDFRDNIKKFDKRNTIILGISADDEASHRKFKDKYDLPFILLSDEDHSVIKEYGVWQEKTMYGKKYYGIARTSFLIDEKGKIQNIFEKVKVNGHIDDLLSSI